MILLRRQISTSARQPSEHPSSPVPITGGLPPREQLLGGSRLNVSGVTRPR